MPNIEQHPDTNMTPVQVAAVTIHEQYKAYMEAGFSRRQAFELVRDMLHDFRVLGAQQ